MTNTVTLNYSAKTLNQAARMQQQFVKQLEVLGYQFKEITATPEGKTKVNVTLVLVRKT